MRLLLYIITTVFVVKAHAQVDILFQSENNEEVIVSIWFYYDVDGDRNIWNYCIDQEDLVVITDKCTQLEDCFMYSQVLVSDDWSVEITQKLLYCKNKDYLELTIKNNLTRKETKYMGYDKCKNFQE